MSLCSSDQTGLDNYSDFEESELKFIDSFHKEIEPIIKLCIRNYFTDKRLHNGEKINRKLLELPYYTDLIIQTSVSDGVNKGYMLIEESDLIIDDEIKYMIKLISKISKYVPQEFVGGMILMHLELIEGMEIW